MNDELVQQLDTAAVFGAAVSLWQAVESAASKTKANLSECYNGVDELMRQVMRIATDFELWACQHVDFNELNENWAYLLMDNFGGACISIFGGPEGFATFDERDSLRVAVHLQLPIKLQKGLYVPIDVKVPNPVAGSGFPMFRVQTMRDSHMDDEVMPFVVDDDPFDGDFGCPYFSLYGVSLDGLVEHITDRQTYAEIVRFAQKLAPGMEFPVIPRFRGPGWSC